MGNSVMKLWPLCIEEFLPSLMLLKENRKEVDMAQLGSKLIWVKKSSCEVVSWWTKFLVILV